MQDVRRASLREVRHIIGAAIAGGRASVPERLGTIALRPQQRDAAARLAGLIGFHGGAMLAEPVGLGKTYTALAVAGMAHETILIAAPAALRAMWTDALAAAGIHASIVTHESLSRGATLATPAGLIIVDEAHRFRSPNTQRYASLAQLCRSADVLLVTATPVQNRRADLAAQLALFLGRRAWQMTDAELAEHVVRDSSSERLDQPYLRGPYEIRLPAPDDCVDILLALPPPIPARQESLAVTLMTYGLVHQWTSSRAALVRALERRRARGLALLAAAESGRRPTRRELAAWTHSEDALQLAFPELVVAPSSVSDVPLGDLAAALISHDGAVRDALQLIRSGADPDASRAAALRAICRDHPNERVIAFCHYAETVNALRSHLAADTGVAALTANGARVAGGRISRDAVLAQFMPPIVGARAMSRSERISLLITTDLLSEGLNLQEASVIVHLDLPWNPARLEQRVGRARRLGSRHSAVTVYTIAPPASSERMLRIDERLRYKLAAAERSIGSGGRVLPSFATGGALPGLAERVGSVRALLTSWIDTAPPGTTPTMIGSDGAVLSDEVDRRTIFAAVRASFHGFLALIQDRGRSRLIVDIGYGVATDVDAVRSALEACTSDAECDDARVLNVLADIREWCDHRRAARAVDIGAVLSTATRRAMLSRIARIVSGIPAHRRHEVGPLAAAARLTAGAPLSEGAERALDALAASPLPDDSWLRAVATLGQTDARARRVHSFDNDGEVRALIVFEAQSSSAGS